MNHPLISVIIPLYNKEECIVKTIESITKQDYDDYEIVVVDDGSIDNSVAVLRELKNDKIKIFTTLSGASLGIYVLHPFIYELMDKYIYGTTADNWQSFLRLMNDPIYMFSLPIVTYFILTPTILLLKRIKLTRVFIP